GHPFTEVAAFRGTDGMSSDPELPGGAAQVFSANCASCHGVLAEGSRDGYFPSLFHNSALSTGGGRNLIATILFGVDRPTAGGLAFMPGFGGKATDIATFSDEKVARLANYLLEHYGNASFRATPELVEDVRSARAPRPLLATLVNLGELVVGALVLV